MRAENAAALTNFVVVLLIAAVWALASGFWSRSSAVVVYADPVKAAVGRFLVFALVATPLAAFIAARTWVHAKRLVEQHTSGWRGMFEAGALGFALTLPLVLPGVVVRQFNPDHWGQPLAFVLGVAYVGFYGLIGAVVGLVLGFLLWLSARLALFVHRTITS